MKLAIAYLSLNGVRRSLCFCYYHVLLLHWSLNQPPSFMKKFLSIKAVATALAAFLFSFTVASCNNNSDPKTTSESSKTVITDTLKMKDTTSHMNTMATPEDTAHKSDQ